MVHKHNKYFTLLQNVKFCNLILKIDSVSNEAWPTVCLSTVMFSAYF